MKPHVVRELVNELRDIAIQYHAFESLREKLAHAVARRLEPIKPGEPGEPVAWITNESWMRLKRGGNASGAVPAHAKRSAASRIPLYTTPADAAIAAARESMNEQCAQVLYDAARAAADNNDLRGYELLTGLGQAIRGLRDA